MNSADKTMSWQSAPDRPDCADGEVHVLAASLKVSPEELSRFTSTLSTSEKERAAKFKFDLHRNRFIAGRGRLRAVLGRYLEVEPAKIDFVSSAQGKPALSPEFSRRGFHFNLAHSEDLALIAVTRTGPVGVDVERIRPIKDADDLVARFFSKREAESYQQLAAEHRPAAFFNLWTRKEALLKATGEGIAAGLNRVEVSFLPDEPARLLAIDGDAEKAGSWSLKELSPAAEFVGAAAIRAAGVRVRSWQWP